MKKSIHLSSGIEGTSAILEFSEITTFTQIFKTKNRYKLRSWKAGIHLSSGEGNCGSGGSEGTSTILEILEITNFTELFKTKNMLR